jgi:hypothetical protein
MKQRIKLPAPVAAIYRAVAELEAILCVNSPQMGYGNDSVQNGPFAEFNGSGHRIPTGSWAMGSFA